MSIVVRQADCHPDCLEVGSHCLVTIDPWGQVRAECETCATVLATKRCTRGSDEWQTLVGVATDHARVHLSQTDKEAARPREEVEHVTLVAIVTTGADAEEAQHRVTAGLPDMQDGIRPLGWDSWWVADDTLGHREDHDVRLIDGSDNDSAVFCNRRTQARSARMLYALNLTEECNADLTVGPQRRLAEVLDGMVSLALEADRLRMEIGGEA